MLVLLGLFDVVRDLGARLVLGLTVLYLYHWELPLAPHSVGEWVGIELALVEKRLTFFHPYISHVHRMGWHLFLLLHQQGDHFCLFEPTAATELAQGNAAMMVMMYHVMSVAESCKNLSQGVALVAVERHDLME